MKIALIACRGPHAWFGPPSPGQTALTVTPDPRRRAADIVRIGLLCAAGVLLASGDGAVALKALLVLAPALAARLARVSPTFELLFTSALAAELAATKLGAYDSISWGDTVSHTVLPFLSGPIAYGLLVRIGIVAEPGDARALRVLLGAATITAILVLALGIAWELVEWTADSALGTDFSQGYADTRGDLIDDALAAACSGALVAGWLRVDGRRPRERRADR
jgi:hypothetical protein